MGAGGRGGCCSCPWTTQLGHGCVGIPWPSPVEVQPCHPAALDRTPKRRSKDVNRRGEKKKYIKTYVPFKGQNHARADRRRHEPTHQPTQLGFSKSLSPLCDMLLHCLAQNFSKTFLCLPSQQWTCANVYSSQIQQTGKEI